MKNLSRTVRAVMGAIFLSVPKISEACTVCFGGGDANLKKGFFWGIILLGSLPFCLMALLVGAITYTSKKNRAQ